MKKLIIISVLLLFIFSCDDDSNPTGPQCNEGLIEIDGECVDECGVPDGDNSTCLDECGIVNGDNSTCEGCDGVTNSGLVNDECGVCDGNNSTCLDECGVINGNTIEMCGSCDYVFIWDVCYNIETTTSIYSNDVVYYLDRTIPPEIEKLVNLTTLRVNNRRLTGEIPPEIGTLINLEVLNFYDNQLSGEIPPEIGNLVNLIWLSLPDNQLSGEIPSEIGNLVNLVEGGLDLSINQLSGEIPQEVCDLIENNNLDIGTIIYQTSLINTCED